MALKREVAAGTTIVTSDGSESKGILDDLAEVTGWDDASKLRIICDYIDGIVGGVDGFRSFASELASEEAKEVDDEHDY